LVFVSVFSNVPDGSMQFPIKAFTSIQVWISLVFVSVFSNVPDGSMQFPIKAFNQQLFPEEMASVHNINALVLFSTKFINGSSDLDKFFLSSASK
jgi:hypothetical protein